MTTLLEFISGLLDGFGLIALALAIGGIAYVLFVLRGEHAASPSHKDLVQESLVVTAAGAGAVALIRIIQLGLKPWALADADGSWAILAFMSTEVFKAGLISVGLVGLLTVAILWLRKDSTRRGRWGWVLLIVALFMINEARLSHGASRVEGGGPLMVATTVHMLGALAWAGGVFHLLLSWRLMRRQSAPAELWPGLVSRFSPLGLVAVGLILLPGLFLAVRYAGSWSALIGTGYGNMLAVKIALFGFVLLLAAVNFLAARAWVRTGEGDLVVARVPLYIEVELILAGALLFTAAALTGFPPAVDVPEHAATPGEIWGMFAPKAPHLVGPEIVLIEAPELTDLRTGEVGWKQEERWDRFNHNVSGVILLIIAALALLDRLGGMPVTRNWPLLFVAFSLLVVLFANPDEWPLGPLGFAESARNPEVVQHWLGALVILGLGVFEWRARREAMVGSTVRYVLPALCIAGGLVLLTHSHQIVELKREFLIQSTHVAMGLVSVFVGCFRWLELRLPPPQDRFVGYLAASGMMLVGLILLFYVTPD